MIQVKNLRMLREKYGLSQQKLAEIFNLSQQSIYKYEKGLSQPDYVILKRFADFFHTTIDYLMGETDFPYKIEHYDPCWLSEAERTMLDHYRSCSPEIRESIHTFLQESKKVIE